MPGYTQYTLDSFCIQLGVLLDDASERYWTRQEKYYAVWEGMRVWGALTAYWRTRGQFPVVPGTALYDLSVQLPNLRTRSWTLQQMVAEIQYCLLEAANGITGAGMSGQVTVASILSAIQRARNRFVLDTHLPVSVSTTVASPPPPNGLFPFANTSVYVHRVSWQDAWTLTYQNLWREDAWTEDKSNQLWTLEPGDPIAFSEAENAPLMIQLYPPPNNAGNLEVISVNSLLIDTTNPLATFAIPDEWVHAVKYAALSELFSAESQLTDPMRAQYAETRYKQAVDGAKEAKSLIRLLLNAVPLPLDTFANVDAGTWYWRNQTGPPEIAGVLYDLFAVSPGNPDRTYGLAADVVQSAPIPVNGFNYIQMGPEDIPHLFDYCLHVLAFKCGGNELKATFPKYDSYMDAVSLRTNINRAKIRYMTPLFGQPQMEEQDRPDEEMATK